MKPTPKCVLDRSRPCIAPDPSSCPYPWLLAEDDTMNPDDDIDTDDDPAHAEK
ncbi:hypothetical protein [Streptomyces sp. Act143]|uniref:hypothetical protein n=1 Tax=Streptomyces sp. Act143 TaxID=2200760 RepID=UPI0015E7FA88|nr:hypothetical protein [Streptomyces sp. Act143]